MKDLRRTVVATVIGSFSLAALMGILALLGAGAFGEGEAPFARASETTRQPCSWRLLFSAEQRRIG